MAQGCAVGVLCVCTPPRSLKRAPVARTQIKGMKDKDLARLWSQYVKELAVLLVRAEGGDPSPEVAARVRDLVQRELLLLYIRWRQAWLVNDPKP